MDIAVNKRLISKSNPEYQRYYHILFPTYVYVRLNILYLIKFNGYNNK